MSRNRSGRSLLSETRSVAFAVAFVWALVVYMTPRLQHARILWWLRAFLVFGTVFALCVLVYEALEYYHVLTLGTSLSCAPGVHPLATPCFIGFLFYATSALVAHGAYRRVLTA